MKTTKTIETELRQAGAPEAEIHQLAELAANIKQLRSTEPPLTPAARRRRGWLPAWPWLASMGAVGLLAGVLVVAWAQDTNPGSWLYPVKRVSEKVAMATDSNYRETLMMRRAHEVKMLVANRSQPQLVTATLADYKSTAAAYHSNDYAVYQYCQDDLKQAQAMANGDEQAEITATLSWLQATEP